MLAGCKCRHIACDFLRVGFASLSAGCECLPVGREALLRIARLALSKKARLEILDCVYARVSYTVSKRRYA